MSLATTCKGIDAKHHLLVSAETTNTAADQGQLAPAETAAKQILQIQRAAKRRFQFLRHSFPANRRNQSFVSP